MKLTDQEQVILKAIQTYGAGRGIATTEHVIKAVGYPKDTTKKVLAGLYNKGVVVLHRYDYARALKPAQRKYLVRMQDGKGEWHYFNAVSVMKRNPKGKHLPGLPAKAQREYEHVLKTELAMGRTTKRAKSIAAGKVKKDYGRKKNKTIIKAKRVVIKKANPRNPTVTARLTKPASARVIKVHNPRKRIKVRNRYIDLVIKGQATKTAEGWKVGRKVYPWGKGTIQVKPHVYLDKSTGFYYVKKERNTAKKKTTKRKRNATRTVSAAKTTKRPSVTAGKVGRKATRSRSRKRLGAKAKPTQTAHRKPAVKARKTTVKRTKAKNPAPMTLAIVNRTSPKARANRKAFAGEYRKDTPLYFPEGTPGGLSKLGKLLEIKTKKVIVKPHTQTWLCRDAQGKFHLGTTSKDAVIWNGPKQDFGQVVRVDYEDVKKHLGYHKPQGFYHFMGEEDGRRPTLYADGKGGLKFRGGNYRITPEGVVN